MLSARGASSGSRPGTRPGTRPGIRPGAGRLEPGVVRGTTAGAGHKQSGLKGLHAGRPSPSTQPALPSRTALGPGLSFASFAGSPDKAECAFNEALALPAARLCDPQRRVVRVAAKVQSIGGDLAGKPPQQGRRLGSRRKIASAAGRKVAGGAGQAPVCAPGRRRGLRQRRLRQIVYALAGPGQSCRKTVLARVRGKGRNDWGGSRSQGRVRTEWGGGRF